MEESSSEIWRPVPEYAGHYEASNLGRIRSVDRRGLDGRRLKGKLLSGRVEQGYVRIKLSLNGKNRSVFAHRLVASAFIGACPEQLQVNHIDGNKLNNRVENLEYLTSGDNTRHAITKGLRKAHGEYSHSAKLTEVDVLEIRRLHALGETQVSIAARYGVTQANIWNILNGISWRHVN